MARNSHPLTEEHLKVLNKLLEECPKTDEHCQRALRCHINCDKEVRDNAEQLAIAQKLKQEYFPDEP